MCSDLQGHIEALVQRLTTKSYQAKLRRRCYMPQANGTERSLDSTTIPVSGLHADT